MKSFSFWGNEKLSFVKLSAVFHLTCSPQAFIQITILFPFSRILLVKKTLEMCLMNNIYKLKALPLILTQ